MENTTTKTEERVAKFHHSSLCQGYVSKKLPDGIKAPYRGRFGEGYTIKSHNPRSTLYCWISYYVYD
jgi:hypothetical protein